MANKSNAKVVIKMSKLSKIIESLVMANGYAIKVGILSSSPPRNDNSKENNASIGAKHEFGSYSDHIPERSFIKMPLTTKTNELVKTIVNNILPDMLEGDLMPTLKKIGLAGEQVIDNAFATGGFGSWKPLSPITIANKGSNAILIDTGQLRRSITSLVVKK